MSEAFKCDSCGEYYDGEPAIITLHPSKFHERMFKYDLCSYCLNKVIVAISKDKVFGDLD